MVFYFLLQYNIIQIITVSHIALFGHVYLLVIIILSSRYMYNNIIWMFCAKYCLSKYLLE